MNTEKLKLSEKITERRTDRLDEWSMDELSRDVSNLETQIAELTRQRDELKGVLVTIEKQANFCELDSDIMDSTLGLISQTAREALSTSE